ncbi:hypothetical protein IWQ60_012212 [Tieghemiomyces parasiticus]|uniref:CASTOR ACT domain-containing protein n=1 Tax=Tieghemiomyces parasiticus TaxID=78921 RepID=A0A9W8DLK8_9FUNG|nr:hypothetical protein IWQ60_012212 [Tieghemiomyces parasiticus]
MHVAILNTRVRILSFPKENLPIWSHDIINLLYRPPRSGYRQEEPFFSLTQNSIEWCLVASTQAFADGFHIPRQARFPRGSGRPYSLTRDMYYVVQVVDNDETEQTNRPIVEMSADFSDAGITIMYISTYQTDFMLIKQRDLREAVTIWLRNAYNVTGLEELQPWNDDVEILRNGQVPHPTDRVIGTREGMDGPADQLEGPALDEQVSAEISFDHEPTEPPVVEPPPPPPLPAPQPASLSIMDFRVRQVSPPYHRRYDWIYSFMSALFFPRTMGLRPHLVRFMSYVAAGEEISLTAPHDFLACLDPEYNDPDSRPQYFRLFEILYRNNLSRSGLVYDMSRRMADADIDLMYVSTYHTACLMVPERDFVTARGILDSHQHIQSTPDASDSGDEGDDDDCLSQPPTGPIRRV